VGAGWALPASIGRRKSIPKRETMGRFINVAGREVKKQEK
jgi:hypothetical protein